VCTRQHVAGAGHTCALNAAHCGLRVDEQRHELRSVHGHVIPLRPGDVCGASELHRAAAYSGAARIFPSVGKLCSAGRWSAVKTCSRGLVMSWSLTLAGRIGLPRCRAPGQRLGTTRLSGSAVRAGPEDEPPNRAFARSGWRESNPRCQLGKLSIRTLSDLCAGQGVSVDSISRESPFGYLLTGTQRAWCTCKISQQSALPGPRAIERRGRVLKSPNLCPSAGYRRFA
jgi:hypothetical protein